MNFQSWQIILLFKLDLNQFETGVDQGLTWTSQVAAPDWCAFAPRGLADWVRSTADPGHPGGIQRRRWVDLRSNDNGHRRSSPEHGGAMQSEATERTGMRGCSPRDRRDEAS